MLQNLLIILVVIWSGLLGMEAKAELTYPLVSSVLFNDIATTSIELAVSIIVPELATNLALEATSIERIGLIATSTLNACSCVKTARELRPDLPLLDAKDIQPNGPPVIGGAVLFQYTNNSHVAIIKEFLPDSFLIYEGNYKPCATGTREIQWNDKFIKGFWN